MSMKFKMSVSLDEETIVLIRDAFRTGSFRNKSHVVEHAVKSYLKEVEK